MFKLIALVLVGFFMLNDSAEAKSAKGVSCRSEDLAKIFKLHAKASGIIIAADINAIKQVLPEDDKEKKTTLEIKKSFYNSRREKLKDLSPTVAEMENLIKTHPECNLNGLYDLILDSKQID